MFLPLLFASACLLPNQGAPSASASVAEPEAPTPPSAPAEPVADAATESERLDAFFEAVFQDELARSPMRQAYLGLKTNNDRWDDSTPAASRAAFEATLDSLERLRSEFDYAALDDQAQLSYRLFEQRSVETIESWPWREHSYPITQMRGAHAQVPTFLANMHTVDSLADADAYLARLVDLGRYFDELIAGLERRAARGILPPRFVFPYVIGACENVLAGKPLDPDAEVDNVIYADFKAKVALLEDVDAVVREALVVRAAYALEEHVRPAYERLITKLREHEALATDAAGCWKLPHGAEYYALRLRHMTTTQTTPDEIHALGLAEVARIHTEMRAIQEQVGFEGTLQDFFVHLREDERFYQENTDAGRAAYLAEADRIVAVMESRLDEVFRTMPKAPMEVRAVEAFREGSAGKAFYQRGTPDGSRPGAFYANLKNMRDMPVYQLEALAYHEGIPGHHMQGSIAQELEHLPKFRRFAGYTAYGEGWGLYCELLPKEMGLYQDPYSDFGRLAMELWRACRLVVDTGIHARRWSREKAIAYLVENTPNPEGDCTHAIERYIVMPGQATAYKVGMLKILELRAMAREIMGDAFDVRDFHEVLLVNGPVPLGVLEELVRDWAESAR